MLKADGITEAHSVHAHVARKQHSSRTPEQRDLSRAMPRSMNDFETTSDGQHLPQGPSALWWQSALLSHSNGRAACAALAATYRARSAKAKRAATLGYGDIERVHVGRRAADMVGAAMRENELLEVV